jgi:tetratricopeptide (TPR) repeat protein
VFQKEKVFAKVLHEVPDEYRYLTLIGGEYARDSEFARAREMYLKALQKYPQKAELYRLIALTYEGQNDLENAVRSREMTRMYDRFNMGNLLQLVDDLVQLNRLEEATRYYQEMTEILPEYPYTLEAAELIKGKRS